MATFRVYTKDRKIKFAGTDHPSFFNTAEQAAAVASFEDGDKVYEYSLIHQRPLWEVCINHK